MIRTAQFEPTRRSTLAPHATLLSAFLVAGVFVLSAPAHAADADSTTVAPAATEASAAPAPATPTAPATATEIDPWARGSQWVALRAGYAKAASKNSADGFGGYGFAYTRFLSRKWAFVGAVHHDVLGRFGSATEIEVPFTVELSRHFRWATPARPYLGFGTGAFFHKTYRTGADGSDVRTGAFLSWGVNSTISDRSLIGLDIRTLFESGAESDNPVFLSDKTGTIHWSVKLNYARFY